jgi:glycosyltransferase involved in cell wall biosynthesis
MDINKETLEQINKYGVSIIIGARNEYPQIALTIGSLIEDLHNSGITKWEIVLQDNGSTDETSRFFAWKPISKGDRAEYNYLGGRWNYIYSPRGLVYEGRLRIFFDPIMSNVGTRNKGVLHSRFRYIIFSDAHITVRPGTVYSIVETLIKFGGIVHAPISWLGASPDNPEPGYQYSYKVGEKIWGTWNKVKVAETPFYIPLCGHAFMGVIKEQFLEYRGYPYHQRVYGGGEPYLDTKYWMVGSHSMMDPRALVYHLSAGRGYNWNNDDLIYNMLLVSYILGGEEWIDRIYITYMNKHGTSKDYMTMLYNQAKSDGQEDKDWLDKHKVRTFEELLGLDKEHLNLPQEELVKQEWYCTKCTKRGSEDPHVMRQWDVENDKLHGNHRSYVQEFRLRKDTEGNVFIGNTPITDEDALKVASKYL